jgi:ArsR family transcriptional regulator, virulence genes transcriptional regulator
MKISKMQASAATATGFLKTLANEHRLLILCQLVEGEKSVGELERHLRLRQPHLSQHLARLRQDGLVRTRRDSRTIFYDLRSREAAEVIDLLYKLFCGRRSATARGASRRRRGQRPSFAET